MQHNLRHQKGALTCHKIDKNIHIPSSKYVELETVQMKKTKSEMTLTTSGTQGRGKDNISFCGLQHENQNRKEFIDGTSNNIMEMLFDFFFPIAVLVIILIATTTCYWQVDYLSLLAFGA